MYILLNKKSYKQERVSLVKNIIRYLICITIIMILILVIISNKSFSCRSLNYEIVQIERGDNLWKIVSKHYIENEDPRKIIKQIKKINNLIDSNLQPGQLIKIPL